MKTQLRSTSRTETDVAHEVSRFTFNLVSVSALILGIWGAACLFNGMLSHGFLPVIRGYVSAITGF